MYALKEKMNESKNFLLQKNLASTNLRILEKEIESSNLTCQALVDRLKDETQRKDQLERDINCILEEARARDQGSSIEHIGKLEEQFSGLKLEKQALCAEFTEQCANLDFLKKKQEAVDALQKEIAYRKNEVYNLNEEIIRENEQCRKLREQDTELKERTAARDKRNREALEQFETESRRQ